MKRFKVFVRKPGSIVWEYADTYDGAATAMMAQRLALVEHPGYAAKVQGVGIVHIGMAGYLDTAEKVLL